MSLSAEDQAAYEERDRLYSTAKQSECSVCGWSMTVRIKDNKAVIMCPRDASHEGYRRLRSLTQLAKEGVYIPYVSERVERQKEEQMEPENRELAVYGTERLPITQGAAERIIRRLWPKASASASEHAMLLAVQENLNPLNHEIYIVPFKGKDGTTSEVVVLGIEANRKMARRRTPYSYKDGPRPLTAQEMEDLGEDPKGKIGVICVLETPAGAVFPGYGFWPRATEPYGADKGNTKFNMASYRAERNALKRVMPDTELPAPVGMVIDGVYADVTELQSVKPAELPKPQPARTPSAKPEASRAPAPTGEASAEPIVEPPPAIRDEDFLAMSDVEQANLLLKHVKAFGRERFAELREHLGVSKTAVELAPEDRLRVLKAVLEATV